MSLPAQLFLHYLEYLSAPAVLLTFCLVVAPLCYGLYDDRKPANTRQTSGSIPGCRRLGSSTPTTKLPKFSGQPRKPRVHALCTYPIDACKGVQLPASEVTGAGFKYDGAFTFAQLTAEQSSPDSMSEPSTKWQHTWRYLSASTAPRLELLDMEIWVPAPRQTSTKVSNGHAKTSSGDKTVFGMQKPRSRSRQGTLVMESAGQEVERLRKFSVPGSEPDFAANGGCLVIKFPFQPDYNPLGLRTETVTIKVPLQPSPARAEAKEYKTEEIVLDNESRSWPNLTSEIEPAALEKLQYFLGISKPLALFLKSTTTQLSWKTDDMDLNKQALPKNTGLLRVLDAESPEWKSQAIDRLRESRPNVVLESLQDSPEGRRQMLAFGRCVQPVDLKAGRGRSAARRETGVAKYASVSDDSDVRSLRPLFEYGIVRVGDLVEVTDGEDEG